MLTKKQTDALKRDANQPRKTFEEAAIDRLGDDMVARGVLVPLLVKPDGTIIDGERRWRAAKLKGIKELPVIVTDKALPEAELLGIQIATAFHRADLNGHDRWQALERLRELQPGWQLQQIAQFLNIDASMVTRLGSPSKCIKAVQVALAEGSLGISDCYAISKLPEAEQAGMLAIKLSGASRDAIEQAGRKTRSVGKAAVRVSRIKCPMTKAIVQISGVSLCLDEAIEAAQEWVKEAKKASEQGLCAKTFERLCRDKSKKG